jgi:hypothetical protein
VQRKSDYGLGAMHTRQDDIFVGVAGLLMLAFWAAVAWQLLT